MSCKSFKVLADKAAEEASWRWICRQGHRHKTKADKSYCNKKHWKALSKEERNLWQHDVFKKRKAAESFAQPPVDEDEPLSEGELSPMDALLEQQTELMALVSEQERIIRKLRFKLLRKKRRIRDLEEGSEYEDEAEDSEEAST